MLNPDPQDIRRASRIFKALAHPDRLRLACRLSSVASITQKALIEEFGWPQSTMARHLGTLREHGLVGTERVGNATRLTIAGPLVQAFLEAMCHWVHPETGEKISTVTTPNLTMAGEPALVGVVADHDDSPT